MITFDFIAGNNIYQSAKSLVELHSEVQARVSEPDEKDKECLDDFLDKIDAQTVNVSGGHIAAYIRTAPVESKTGLLARIKSAFTNQTVEEIFDVHFRGMDTEVYERHSKGKVVYDIFINAAEKSVAHIKKGRDPDIFLHPTTGKQRKKDPGKIRSDIASFTGSLGQLYQQLGVKDGNLVLVSVSDRPFYRTDCLDRVRTGRISEVDRYGDCTFYQVAAEKRAVCALGETRPVTRARKKAGKKNGESPDFTSPRDVRKVLDSYVIGQAGAKAAIADAVCDHYMMSKSDNLAGAKANILLIGPSGSGKTYLAKVVANDILNAPFYETSLAGMTRAGYVGTDVSSILEGLIESSSLNKAEHGVVFLDEIDKIRAGSGDKGVGSSAVQNELLRMLNGDMVDTRYGTIDTSKILFICAGAFEELRHVDSKGTIGFGPRKEQKPKGKVYHASEEALIAYGLKRELVGRLPHTCIMDELSEQDLKQVLTAEKGSLIQTYTNLFKQYNIELEFTTGAIGYIAKAAFQKGTGARALKSIIAETMRGMRGPSTYLKERKLTITPDVVREQMETGEQNDRQN